MASIAPIVIGCIDYLVAYGTIFTHAIFRPKIKLDVFFARKAVDECWEVVRRTTQKDHTQHQLRRPISTRRRYQVHQTTQTSGQGIIQPPLGQQEQWHAQTVRQESKHHQHHHNEGRLQLQRYPKKIERQRRPRHPRKRLQ